MGEPNPIPNAGAEHPPRAGLDMLPTASLAAIPIRTSRSRLIPPPATRQAQAATPQAPASAPRDGDPAALAAWWRALKRGRDFPSPDDLDTEAIAATWPEAVLLGYDSRQAEITGATRLKAGSASGDNAIEYSPMVTEWLLALGRKAARQGAVMCETKDFPVERGMAAYRIVSLPLRAGRHGVDQVLCHLGRA
jgi:hypothetical protein